MEMTYKHKSCIVTTWDRFSIWIYTSHGCRFRKAGSCIMCNYGNGKLLWPWEAYHITKNNIELMDDKLDIVLIGAYGSILDPKEVPTLSLRAICLVLAKSRIPTVIFETHYTTINTKILDSLKRWLPNKEIIIEMGFESSSKDSRAALQKNIDEVGLFHRMNMIHDHGMKTILNVMVGIPGLTVKEQVDDAVASVKTAFFYGADEVTLFPMNIKPLTKLAEMYRHHQYSPPSSWMLIEVLNRLEPRMWERITFSWYGDRQYYGRHTEIIPPRTCPACKNTLHNFFTEWNRRRNLESRESALRSINNTHVCVCHDLLKKHLKN